MPGHRSPLRAEAALSRRALLRALRRDASGISLIEVMISALLTAVIAVGVLTGFQAAADTANNNRLHDEATLLASQSQEELRTDPASALTKLVGNPHVYSQTVSKEVYTVTQEASLIKKEGNAGCSAGSGAGSGSSHEPSENVEVRSVVSWPGPTNAARLSVESASILTPPDGSALDVEVSNGAAEPLPVSGASVTADSITTSTDSEGCVLYTAIPATSVSVLVTKPNYVTPAGVSSFEKTAIPIAPNIITRVPVTMAEAGAALARFTYAGTTSEHNGRFPSYDTLSAYNTHMETSTNFDIAGSNSTLAANHYATSIETERTLFPFPETERWAVFAGDCPADNPETASGGKVAPGKLVVVGGATEPVAVPLSYVTLELYTGTKSSPGSRDSTTEYPVKITNSPCASAIPSNATSANDVSEQRTTQIGALTQPFQPFGTFSLCVLNATAKRTYTAKYTNSTEAGTTLKMYLKESIGEHEGVTVAEKSSC